ncbi:MAG: histone deacetylase [Planctomycetota bacterium]
MPPNVAYAYAPSEQAHSRVGHPECRERLGNTIALLTANGILERLIAHRVLPAGERLELVHPRSYVKHVRSFDTAGPGMLDSDTYCCPGSFRAADEAAGALLGLVAEICKGTIHRGMALMRPPGHHALADAAMGFCIFANAAIAARYAREACGADRVLIVDWDVHHGNGTQAIFYEDPSIAYFSTHQFPYYPGTGAADEIGAGAGKGATFNAPLPAGVGDRGFLQIYERLFVPYAERFKPDLILVSAGFDAHWRDPLAQERMTLNGFAELTRLMIALADRICGGRLLIALEGGYDLEVLPHAVLNTLTLLEDPAASIVDRIGPAPAAVEPNVEELIERLRLLHRLQ